MHRSSRFWRAAASLSAFLAAAVSPSRFSSAALVLRRAISLRISFWLQVTVALAATALRPAGVAA